MTRQEAYEAAVRRAQEREARRAAEGRDEEEGLGINDPDFELAE